MISKYILAKTQNWLAIMYGFTDTVLIYNYTDYIVLQQKLC